MDPTTPDELQAASPPLPPLSPPIEETPPPENSDILSEPDSQQRSGLRWIIGSGLVALVGIGGWLGYQTLGRPPSAPIEVVTVPATRENLEVTITEAGVVELGGQQTFKAPSDVTVQAVLVEERQRVSAGQVLIELRDRTLQQTLDDQLVENRINQLTLQRDREILEERRSRLAEADARLQDSQELLDQGYISEDDFRQDVRAVEDARSSVRDAEVQLAQTELQTQQDQVKTDNIRLQLEDNQILSPIDAIVLKVDVKAGDGVEREGRLLSIGDPAQEIIRLQLTTLNAGKVAINQPVRVRLIGPNPEAFPGRIARVSPQAVSENADNAEQATVEAEARLNQSSDILIPGSAVSVEIILNQRPNALVIPVTALQRDAANPYVWVRDADNTAQQREIETGLETLEAIEVVAGLQPGDEVIVSLPPDETLTPGQPLMDPQPAEGVEE
ncbi:MAG: efflux RND transporter periplasmic adaptor subunit [Cyanobacteria bacterium P01_F01_bin.86]